MPRIWMIVTMVAATACGSSASTTDASLDVPALVTPDGTTADAPIDAPVDGRLDAPIDAPVDAPPPDALSACAVVSAELEAQLYMDTACAHDEDCAMIWGAGDCELVPTLGSNCFIVGNTMTATNDAVLQDLYSQFHGACTRASCGEPGVSCLVDCAPARSYTCNSTGHCEAATVGSCFGDPPADAGN